MSEHEHITEKDLPPVQTVGCSQCGAEPNEDCQGPGRGWHLSRWDRLHESRVIPPDAT